jgi:hypothetical protein
MLREPLIWTGMGTAVLARAVHILKQDYNLDPNSQSLRFLLGFEISLDTNSSFLFLLGPGFSTATGNWEFCSSLIFLIFLYIKSNKFSKVLSLYLHYFLALANSITKFQNIFGSES